MLLRMTKIVQSAKQPMLNLPTKIHNDVIPKVATKIGKYKDMGIEFKRLGNGGMGERAVEKPCKRNLSKR